MKRSVSPKASFLPPLFDRLTQDDVGLLDEDGLKASIQKEISLMFNTRVSTYKQPQGEFELLEGPSKTTDHLYSFPELLGLADFSFFDVANSQEWRLMERHMESSLRAFEPRLKNPRVKIGGFEPKKQELSLMISGEIIFGKSMESISFPLDVDLKYAAHS